MDVREVTTTDELEQLVDVALRVFAEDIHDDAQAALARWLRPHHAVGAFDGRRVVGSAAAVRLELTLPGDVVSAAAGVTVVGVLPTHRRRKLLTAMMEQLLDGARAAGQPLAVLHASESTIYRRFGFGPATFALDAQIDTVHAAFERPVEATGRIDLVQAGEALRTMPELFDLVRRKRHGEVSRDAAWWDVLAADPEGWREGGGPLQYALHHDVHGAVDGYALYRITPGWDGELPTGRLRVDEVAAPDPRVYAALWRYLLDVDLVSTVDASHLRPDEPLRWLLSDPRRLRATAYRDALWVRVLDVPRCLTARRYPADGTLVLDVSDRQVPANAGRWLLQVEGGAAACEPATVAADLTLDVADLGVLLLGGVRPAPLAAAGRVMGDEEAVRRAARLFAWDRPPHCATDF